MSRKWRRNYHFRGHSEKNEVWDIDVPVAYVSWQDNNNCLLFQWRRSLYAIWPPVYNFT